MIRIAIVEDDANCAKELEGFFARYQSETGCFIQGDRFPSADRFLARYHRGAYHMIFMDIEMPGTDGMTASKRLREIDREVLLIFVTNLSQYALESYEVQAFNFIVKPIVYNNFFLKMERAVHELDLESDQKILLSVRDGDRSMDKIISIRDVRFVEVFGHKIIYHTTKGDVCVRDGSMKSIAERLIPYGFSMCDQSYLVNLAYITAIDKDEVYLNEDVIKISRRRRESFLADVAKRLSFGQVKK